MRDKSERADHIPEAVKKVEPAEKPEVKCDSCGKKIDTLSEGIIDDDGKLLCIECQELAEMSDKKPAEKPKKTNINIAASFLASEYKKLYEFKNLNAVVKAGYFYTQTLELLKRLEAAEERVENAEATSRVRLAELNKEIAQNKRQKKALDIAIKYIGENDSSAIAIQGDIEQALER